MKKVIKDGTVTLTGRGPLTAKEKKELLALSKLPDSEINLSDIPELTGGKGYGSSGSAYARRRPARS